MIENFDDSMSSAKADTSAEDNLQSIDIEYIMGMIDDQLKNITSSGNNKNFFKYFEKQVDNLRDLQDPGDIKDIENTMYTSILNSISDRFDISIDTDINDLRDVAKVFYKFFVNKYSTILSQFIISYIRENREDVVHSISHMDGVSTRDIPGMNSDIGVILNNMSKVIEIIAETHVDFYDFLDYVEMHPDSPAVVDKIRNYYNDYVDDTDVDIVNKLMEPITNEEEDFGDILIAIQTEIYEDFEEDD